MTVLGNLEDAEEEEFDITLLHLCLNPRESE
jgi:hypothetical protein